MVIKSKQNINRLYFLDWVRVLAFGLLVFYHTGLVFVDWGFHIQNDVLTDSLKPFLLFLNQWRLPLLFLVSGAGTRFALGKRTSTTFLKERIIRLFIPLVFGILVVIPPQTYYERLSQHAFEGSYLQFYPHFFDGVYPTGNFTWNHLWFVVYLLTYSIFALPLFVFLRSKQGEKILSSLSNFLAKGFWVLTLIIPLILTEVLLRSRWPDTRNLISDWYNFIFYLIIFIYGYFLASSQRLWTAIENHRRIYLALGIISFIMIYFGWHQAGESFLEPLPYGKVIFVFFKCLNILSWMLVALGYAKRYLNYNSQGLAYANKAVYPFYILHQTVLIVIGYYIIHLNLGLSIKYFLIVLATYLITMLIYEFIIRRISIIKVFFGVKEERKKEIIPSQIP